MHRIRLVTFDALHTIIKPRLPVHVQYSQVFLPYLGCLPPESIKASFKQALKTVQKQHPSYNNGAEKWWSDVIRRTALQAGANEDALDTHLPDIVGELLKRFSSGVGYTAFNDAIYTIRHLRDQLGISTAVVSNGDRRLRAVLKDLNLEEILDPIVLSEELGAEKPSSEIFLKTLELVNERMDAESKISDVRECLHVGDEYICDYVGPRNIGWNALLLRREGRGKAAKEEEAAEVIHNLDEIIKWVGK